MEDDPALSQGIRLALGQEGRQFVQAGTIGQAERELAERTFDLLILDLNLPDGNGLDLLSRLRDRSALPVLILTANDLEMDQVTGLEPVSYTQLDVYKIQIQASMGESAGLKKYTSETTLAGWYSIARK